jgi:copper(I)-binding protein
MKTMLSLWRHHYLRMFSMFLIAVVLIAGIVSCAGDGGDGGGVKPLDHFKGYGIDVVNIPYINKTVEVGDQFGNWTATVTSGVSFANPVNKTYEGVTTGISDEVCHYMGFGLEGIEPEPKWWRVTVDNQFGPQNLTVYGPTALSVPTGKNSLGEPQGCNCYLNYEVIDPSSIDVVVNLTDQFGTEQNVLVTQAGAFGNPAWMKYNGELMEIVNEDDHAVGYWFNSTATYKNEIVVSNVFGNWTVNVTEPKQNEGVLSVPSEKISSEPIPPLGHLKGYGIDVVNIPYVGENVTVGDQFGNWTATVGWGASFANPVEKTYNGVTEGILDEVCHFMGFGLEGIVPHEWVVEVNNQFGTQNLTVYGPTGLSVPTEKNSLGEPEGYNCYLNYDIIDDPPPIGVVVNLTDQFGTEQNVLVTQAWGFANPAWMKYNGELMEIVNEDDHAVGYWFNSTSMYKNEIVVSNVFGNWTVNVTEPKQNEGILSVPSEKINWYPS